MRPKGHYLRWTIHRTVLLVMLANAIGCVALQCYVCSTDESRCTGDDGYCGIFCESSVLEKSFSVLRPQHCRVNETHCVRETFKNQSKSFVDRYCSNGHKGNQCVGDTCYRSCKNDGCNGFAVSTAGQASTALLAIIIGSVCWLIM